MPRLRQTTWLLGACTAVLASASSLGAQEGRVPARRLAPTDEPVRLDGLLSESVWRDAEPIDAPFTLP